MGQHNSKSSGPTTTSYRSTTSPRSPQSPRNHHGARHGSADATLTISAASFHADGRPKASISSGNSSVSENSDAEKIQKQVARAAAAAVVAQQKKVTETGATPTGSFRPRSLSISTVQDDPLYSYSNCEISPRTDRQDKDKEILPQKRELKPLKLSHDGAGALPPVPITAPPGATPSLAAPPGGGGSSNGSSGLKKSTTTDGLNGLNKHIHSEPPSARVREPSVSASTVVSAAAAHALEQKDDDSYTSILSQLFTLCPSLQTSFDDSFDEIDLSVFNQSEFSEKIDLQMWCKVLRIITQIKSIIFDPQKIHGKIHKHKSNSKCFSPSHMSKVKEQIEKNMISPKAFRKNSNGTILATTAAMEISQPMEHTTGLDNELAIIKNSLRLLELLALALSDTKNKAKKPNTKNTKAQTLGSGGVNSVGSSRSLFSSASTSASSSSLSLIRQRLSSEILFFHDSLSFLYWITALHQHYKSVSQGFYLVSQSQFTFPSLLELTELIGGFLSAKNGENRRKVMKTFELRFKEKEKQLEKAAKIRSKNLEAKLQSEAEAYANISSLLLLGAGESGKSTIFKQVQRTYGEGFDDEERRKFKLIVFANILRAIKSLIYHSDNLLQRFPFSSLSNSAAAATTAISKESDTLKQQLSFLDLHDLFDYEKNSQGKPIPQILKVAKNGQPADDVMNDVLKIINSLWLTEKGLHVTIENRALFDRFQLFDSDGYFLDRLASGALFPFSRYLPSIDDVIRVRQRTCGVIEYPFAMNDQRFKLLDVAGQRSERRKWLQYFGDVTAVIFVAAVSEYDQLMIEDAKTNRVHDSIDLFGEIINHPAFKETPVVLFLNKRDLFADKIRRVPLTVCFPKYRPNGGGPDYEYEYAIDFLKKSFLKKRNDKKKDVHVHVVCAVDPDNIERVMSSVKQLVIQISLNTVGLK